MASRVLLVHGVVKAEVSMMERTVVHRLYSRSPAVEAVDIGESEISVQYTAWTQATQRQSPNCSQACFFVSKTKDARQVHKLGQPIAFWVHKLSLFMPGREDARREGGGPA